MNTWTRCRDIKVDQVLVYSQNYLYYMDKAQYLILGTLWMRPTFVYVINNVITKLYMWRHVSGGFLCNEYCIRLNHEQSHFHFIMSFTVETIFSFEDLDNSILILISLWTLVYSELSLDLHGWEWPEFTDSINLSFQG